MLGAELVGGIIAAIVVVVAIGRNLEWYLKLGL